MRLSGAAGLWSVALGFVVERLAHIAGRHARRREQGTGDSSMKHLQRTAAAAGAAWLLILSPDFGTFAAAATAINPPRDSVDVYRALELFGDAFSLVRANYVDKLSDK